MGRTPNTLSVTLDVAAMVGACIWPLVMLVVLLAYRQKIPAIIAGVASRVTGVSVAGLSLDLAVAKPFVPDWTASPNALDLRRTATAVQVSDSTAATFLSQILEQGAADYAEINLGAGSEWLTSRLYIIAIIYARIKGIQGFVFVESAGSTRRRYLGWAEPTALRWALARHYPWLEQAYAEAYAETMQQPNVVITSSQGGLGYTYAPRDSNPGVSLLKAYLQRVQVASPPPDPGEWVRIDPATNTQEHAGWITGERIETLLGGDLHTAAVRSADIQAADGGAQLRIILRMSGRYVAVVGDDRRYEYLVDRRVLVEQAAQRAAASQERG